MLHQKRSELLRLSIIIALLAVSVGIILVQSAKVDTSPQQSNPIFAKASTNSSVNFTIEVAAGSNTVRYIGINKPATYSNLNCANLLPVDSAGSAWTCTESAVPPEVQYTSSDGLTGGNSLEVKINATAGAASGNVSFTINTFENTAGSSGQNNTKVNVTVDGEVPIITALNLTSGTVVVTNLTNNTFVAKNNLVIAADVISNLAPTASGEVAVYFNVTNTSNPLEEIPHPRTAGTFLAQLQMSTTDTISESTGRFNATIPSTFISNGSIVTFVIVANDTVGNENVTNTSIDGTFHTLAGLNVTVDDDPPRLIINDTYAIDDIYDAAADNITTSSQIHNFTIIVDNTGGSQIYGVYINVSGMLTQMDNSACTANPNCYNITTNLTTLGLSPGDQNVTIYFVANDTVGNLNNTVGLNLLVDDPDFVASLATVNTSTMQFNFTTSNATIVNITATITATINTSQGSNVTIHGPNGPKYNMTLMSTTTRWGGIGTAGQKIYQSTWFSSVQPSLNMTGGLPNNVSGTTWSNLSDFGCNIPTGDGDTCPLQITWNDIFGRQNSSNITITVDGVAPIVVNLTVSNVTDTSTGSSTNHFVTRASSILNFSVNAYNNVQNVTIHNSTNAAQLTNVTALNAGGETNYSIQLSTDLLCGTGVEGACTVNFTVIDQALNTNTSQLAVLKLTIDESAPLVGSFAINGTVSSGYSSVPGALFMVVRSDTEMDINVTLTDQRSSVIQANLGNTTLRNLTLTNQDANFSNTSTLVGYGCPAGVEVNCTLSVQVFDNVSLSNNSVRLTFLVDDLAPRVYNLTTDLSLKHRVGGITNNINFSVNISDANLGQYNVSIASTNSVQMNRSGSTSGNSTSVTYWVVTTLTTLGCAENANCTVTVFANDSAGNVNGSVSISVLSDNAVLAINNRTWAAAFKDVVFATPNPTLTVNMSSAAQCRYAAGSLTNYSDMSSQFNVEGTRHTSFTLSNLLDADYEYPISCVDLDGDNVASSTVKFRVDTTSLWNITIGATGALSAKADYFWNANRWYSTAILANTNILTTTSHNDAADTYNVTNVLASLVSANPSGATNNLSVMFAHNTVANTWTSYIPGDQAGNDFLNFTSDVTTYYFNLSQGNERLEIG